MRIAMIGHGRIEIPPKASGAVESIISDVRFHCEKLGHDVLVVNEKDPVAAMWDAYNFNPDVIHLHDESKIDELAKISAPIKIVTTHDPEFFEKRNPFLIRFVEGDFLVGCLCQRYADLFLEAGVAPDRILLTPNGARKDLIRFTETPERDGLMICLGMIGQRKRQHLLFPMPFIDCVGPVAKFEPIDLNERMFAEWNKEGVYQDLTDYSALVLLSKSEAAPLVVMEALMAGLDVVVSEVAAANLDRSQPFIHVLDEQTINNPTLLEIALKKVLNRPKDRAAVRRYAEQHHDWEPLVKSYLTTLWNKLKTVTACC